MYVYQWFWSCCWLQCIHMKHMYWHICLISAHEVIWLCDIYVAFEGYICCWHIYGNCMVGKSCSLILTYICAVMWIIYVDYRIYVWSVADIFDQVHMPAMWNMCIPVLLGNTVDCIEVMWGYILTQLPSIFMYTNLHMWHFRGIFVVGHVATAW